VLFVCTANVLRSPCAELMTRTALDLLLGSDAGSVEVASAGTWASVDRGVDRSTVPSLAAFGVPAADVQSFAARQLTRELVGWADLILVAAIEHRRAVWCLDLPARHRTFTMHEFGHLLTRVPDQTSPDPGESDVATRGRALIVAADAIRERLRAHDPTYDAAVGEVPDPAGETAEVTAVATREVAAALRPFWQALAPAR